MVGPTTVFRVREPNTFFIQGSNLFFLIRPVTISNRPDRRNDKLNKRVNEPMYSIR